MRHIFVCFLEEIEDTKKNFRNYLTFSGQISGEKILTNWILCAYDVKSFSWPRIQGAGQLVVHLIQCETSCNLIRKCTKVIDPKYYKHLKEPAQHSHFGHIKNWLVSVRYTVNVLSAESTDECLRTKSQDN
jgi:hypothetical protein